MDTIIVSWKIKEHLDEENERSERRASDAGAITAGAWGALQFPHWGQGHAGLKKLNQSVETVIATRAPKSKMARRVIKSLQGTVGRLEA